MNTRIRTAAPSDVTCLADLSCRTIGACYRSFLGDGSVDAFIESGAVDQYVRDNIDRCAVILGDEKIVGYAVWRDDLIDLMMIDHATHRQSLGTALLRHVEEALFRNHHSLRLESFEGNENANAFYRKNGWCEASRYFDEESGSRKIVFTKSA